MAAFQNIWFARFGWLLNSLTVVSQIVLYADSCEIQEQFTDSVAQAWIGANYVTTSGCVGMVTKDYELHVLGLYEAAATQYVGTSRVSMQGQTNKPVILVLVNVGHVNWILQIPNELEVPFILQVTNSTLSGVDVLGDPSIPVSRTTIPEGQESLSDQSHLLESLSEDFVPVTSFTGTNIATTWSLRVGPRDEAPPNTGLPPTTPETTPPTTVLPTTTPETTIPRVTCDRSNYCRGGSPMGAVCKNGYCECEGTGYNKYTCLPEVGSCRILANQADALASVQSRSNIHSCVGSSDNSTFEVHVLGIYENSGSRTNIYPTVVKINGETQKPIILVVTNYEPVRWIIQGDERLYLRQVLMFSYHEGSSSVSIDGTRDSSSVLISKSRSPTGLGDDTGGGSTAELLTLLTQRFGSVASFTGTYSTSYWNLTLPAPPTTLFPATACTVSRLLSISNLPRTYCLFGNYCSGGTRLQAVCVDGYCECRGAGYNRYTCLPESGPCRILGDQQDAIGAPTMWTGSVVYSCVGSSVNSEFEVHVIGMYQNTASRSTIHNTTVTIEGVTSKPMVLVLATYKPVQWIIQASDHLDLREIMLFSSNLDRVSVEINGLSNPSNVKVNRTGINLFGYGYDMGGGSTAGLLSLLTSRFGAVTSFSGTYSTRAWTLSLHDSAELCLVSPTCWLEYKFTYDASYSSCSGRQFVKKTRFSVGKYIGVVLCSDNRYKLLMADNLHQRFLNIGDGHGTGEDLCNLVGGNENAAVIPGDFWDSPRLEGYFRSNAGCEFQRGPIGFGPQDGSNWTGKYFPTWYECGVTIPGNSSVYSSPIGPFSTS